MLGTSRPSRARVAPIAEACAIHERDGNSVMQRITWKVQDDGVRESAVLSRDGGKTWTAAFDVIFLKRQGS